MLVEITAVIANARLALRKQCRHIGVGAATGLWLSAPVGAGHASAFPMNVVIYRVAIRHAPPFS